METASMSKSHSRLMDTLINRFATVKGNVLDLEVIKPYSSGLTNYYVYVTFSDCAGPIQRYHRGRELDRPFAAFRLRYQGKDTLEEYTSNPDYLALDCYFAKYRFLSDQYETDKKYSEMYRTQKDYSRTNTEYQVALIRGKCNQYTTMEKLYTDQQNAYSAMYNAIKIYDETCDRIDKQIGQRPNAIPHNYQMYRNR